MSQKIIINYNKSFKIQKIRLYNKKIQINNVKIQKNKKKRINNYKLDKIIKENH